MQFSLVVKFNTNGTITPQNVSRRINVHPDYRANSRRQVQWKQDRLSVLGKVLPASTLPKAYSARQRSRFVQIGRDSHYFGKSDSPNWYIVIDSAPEV